MSFGFTAVSGAEPPHDVARRAVKISIMLHSLGNILIVMGFLPFPGQTFILMLLSDFSLFAPDKQLTENPALDHLQESR
jgi:hypothetical protein